MSFSANKNLELVARGGEVGTWDTPTNSNWSIVDNSFGGTATVALTNSPVALSPTQYQCAFITFTGAISAHIAVTLPAVGSFYTIQNLTSNTSAFYVTMATTAAGGQVIGIPPGEATEIFTDGTNVKYRGLGRIGTYWDYAGSSVPAWVTACSVPPYLNCDGTAFSSATYPVLSTILGGVTLPDSKGRFRLALDQGATRVTSAVSNVAGNTLLAAGGAQSIALSSINMPPVPYTDTGHTHGLHINGSVSVVSGGGVTVPAAGSDPFSGSKTQSMGLTDTSSTLGLTIGSTAPTAVVVMPPTYVGGLTLIRAA